MEEYKTSTINNSMTAYLTSVQSARRLNTYKAYKNATKLYLSVLEDHGLKPSDPLSSISEEFDKLVSFRTKSLLCGN